jgi:hypothetical protein
VSDPLNGHNSAALEISGLITLESSWILFDGAPVSKVLTFWWHTETESTDYLTLSVNDKEELRTSGSGAGWVQQSVTLGVSVGKGALHKLRWTLEMDGNNKLCPGALHVLLS